MSGQWWPSSSSQSWEEGIRNSWHSRLQESPADKKDKEKDRDRFKNVISLGASSKHPLPLEDRKSLLVAVMNQLSPQKVVLSKIAASAFTATTTHALLWLLCRAGPRMPIRLLRDEDQVFTIESAARQLAESAVSLHSTQELGEIFTMIHDTCWEAHGETILKTAVQAGFDPSEVEDELRSSWHSRTTHARGFHGHRVEASGHQQPASFTAATRKRS